MTMTSKKKPPKSARSKSLRPTGGKEVNQATGVEFEREGMGIAAKE